MYDLFIKITLDFNNENSDTTVSFNGFFFNFPAITITI